ncbi:MAG: Unknown protein [uncultured Thiotrichaceae bacterium]|uniref:Phosphatidylglycerol lysyltransferase C-terminal domain-containing protein n=1 Tax=uncultured Thiotrichaceae bacterium TaxID=298394 RepID=A0A6S6SDG8_9GAMM|nr:MAG: Unknown protein [uncultured Thiotrichaceae bacterium]
MNPAASPSVQKHALLWPHLKQCGDQCISYSVLQPELQYFFVQDIGFIAYQQCRHGLFAPFGRTIVLGNPMCSEKHYRWITMRFLEKYPKTIFLQVERNYGEVLQSLGHEVNCFGTETELTLDGFSLAGKARSKLRQWQNGCQRKQVEVREENFSDVNLSAITQLSDSWIKRRGGHELRFLTRPFLLHGERDVRLFTAYQGESLLGFAVFDPMYREGEIIGYYHNVDRLAENAPHGTSAYIILKAMDIFRSEKKERVSLGLSPLFRLREPFTHRKFTADALWFTYHKLNFLYPFQGNASHKKKFNGQQKQVFFSSTQGNSLRELFIIIKALRLF